MLSLLVNRILVLFVFSILALNASARPLAESNSSVYLARRARSLKVPKGKPISAPPLLQPPPAAPKQTAPLPSPSALTLPPSAKSSAAPPSLTKASTSTVAITVTSATRSAASSNTQSVVSSVTASPTVTKASESPTLLATSSSTISTISTSSAVSNISSTTSSESPSNSVGASCPALTKRSLAALQMNERRRELLVIRSGGTPVCGIDSRQQRVATAGCVANDKSFVLQGDILTEVTGQATGTECDHTLELQVLASTLNNNGVCVALAGMLSVSDPTSATSKKATLLQPIFAKINAQSNALFLDSGVNAKKKVLIQHGLGDKIAVPNTNSDATIAGVKKLLQDTQVTTKALATDLDTAITDMLNTAQTQALASIKQCAPANPTGRQQSAINTKNNAVNDAKAKADATQTISSAWAGVLDFVANTQT
ncbi:hypothetical protein K439DRAFT_1611582 [Ramaria rubella]|nr:hypothetical protein K439DRAFT_1611582 [Ramaria rubella]